MAATDTCNGNWCFIKGCGKKICLDHKAEVIRITNKGRTTEVQTCKECHPEVKRKICLVRLIPLVVFCLMCSICILPTYINLMFNDSGLE